MRRSLDSTKAVETWRVPQCPFPIEWSAGVFEEIRVAAVDAFLSVPHGGMEIGGVLYGTHKSGLVIIKAARLFECEHALGPTFTLSDTDHRRLTALVADGCPDFAAQGWQPVGWYHSHTRSEIFLSLVDVEIHNRYFPEKWHVALVVRPHLMEPSRAGFFFREADGSIHAASSYHEFILEPMKEVRDSKVEHIEAAAPVETTVPVAIAAPAFQPPKLSWGRLWWAVVMIMLALSAGLLKLKSGSTQELPQEPGLTVSLTAYDIGGQLQIHWDRSAEPIRSAETGALSITDRGEKTVIMLDKLQLRSGTVSYLRAGSRVDLHLRLYPLEGRGFEELTSFVGARK
jgi:hypothetical protein